MRKSPRTVIPLVVFGLVAAGGLTAGLTQVAHAQAVSCTGTGTDGAVSCTTNTVTIDDPATITIVVDLTASDNASPADQDVVVTYEGDCDQGSTDDTIASSASPTPEAITTASEVSVSVPLPMTDPDYCDITATATLETTSGSTTTSGTFTLDVNDTTFASSSTTTATTSSSSSVDVSYIGGYDGKCIDDRGNGSSNGSQLIIWGCNHGDSAQGWTWTDYELRHNGMCANDPGYGGSGTKLILYSCNGGANEKWSHVSYGVFKLFYSGKGQLCLDDPGYSKTNGTRLSVYTCNNGSNQHWSRS